MLLQPQEVLENNMNNSIVKVNLSMGKMVSLGILAGAFIAFGAQVSSVAAHSIDNVGIARYVMGLVFPIGLIMITMIGGELFTGNCLMIMSVLSKRITWGKFGKSMCIVYLANAVGAFVVAILIYSSGQLGYSSGGLGAYVIKTAYAKISLTPMQCFTSGILCNIMVCLAILMAQSTKSATGKIISIFFPICVFVISGFEHCVANMYYIPAGMLAATNQDYVNKAETLYHITKEQCASINFLSTMKNLIPVTIGNVVGGAVCIGMLLYYIRIKKSVVKS
ncbi:formate/nitrite transporter family protein [Lachnospiraceae bacterium ZAX-1]